MLPTLPKTENETIDIVPAEEPVDITEILDSKFDGSNCIEDDKQEEFCDLIARTECSPHVAYIAAFDNNATIAFAASRANKMMKCGKIKRRIAHLSEKYEYLKRTINRERYVAELSDVFVNTQDQDYLSEKLKAGEMLAKAQGWNKESAIGLKELSITDNRPQFSINIISSNGEKKEAIDVQVVNKQIAEPQKQIKDAEVANG